MRIGIIAAADSRNRQRFISQPLLRAGHSVRVLKTKPLILYIFTLRRFLTKDKPDAIIFMGAGVKELFAFIFAELYRVPCVVRLGGDRIRDLDSVIESLWQSGSYSSWLKFKIVKFFSKIFLKKMRWAILVNQALVKRVENQLRKGCKIFIVSQYSDGPAVTRKYSIFEPIEMLTVTNFLFSEKSKGVIRLIEQLNTFVQKENVAINFVVAGDGIHLKDVIKFLQKTSLSELLNVELVGFVTDLSDYYSRADIFLYHSFHDATPNVILESKRYGLPILANDCEEFRELIENGKSGFLYRSKLEFHDLIRQMINNQELRKTVGCAALHEHITKFSFGSIQKQIEASLIEVSGASN